jgi:hypothetical protein
MLRTRFMAFLLEWDGRACLTDRACARQGGAEVP